MAGIGEKARGRVRSSHPDVFNWRTPMKRPRRGDGDGKGCASGTGVTAELSQSGRPGRNETYCFETVSSLDTYTAQPIRCLFSSFIEHRHFAGAISQQRAAKPSREAENLLRSVGTKIASTIRRRMTLIGIVFISIADAKRRGRRKVAPHLGVRGKRNGSWLCDPLWRS